MRWCHGPTLLLVYHNMEDTLIFTEASKIRICNHRVAIIDVLKAMGSTHASKLLKDRTPFLSDQHQKCIKSTVVDGSNIPTPTAYMVDLLDMLFDLVASNNQCRPTYKKMVKTLSDNALLIMSGDVAGATAAAERALEKIPEEVRATLAASSENPTGAIEATPMRDMLLRRDAVHDALAVIKNAPHSASAHAAIKVLDEYRRASKRMRIANTGDSSDEDDMLPPVAAIDQAVDNGLLPSIDPTRVNVPGMPGITILKDHPLCRDVKVNRVHAVTYFFASYLFGLLGKCNDTEWVLASILCKVVRVTNNKFPFNHSDWLDSSIDWKEAPYPILPVNMELVPWANQLPWMVGILDSLTIDYNLFKIPVNFYTSVTMPDDYPTTKNKKKPFVSKYKPMCGFDGRYLVDINDPLHGEHARMCPPIVTYQYLYRVFQHHGMAEANIRPYVLTMLRTYLSKLPFKYIELIFGPAMKHDANGFNYLPISEDEMTFRHKMKKIVDENCGRWYNVPYLTPMAVMNLCMPADQQWSMGTPANEAMGIPEVRMDYRLLGKIDPIPM